LSRREGAGGARRGRLNLVPLLASWRDTHSTQVLTRALCYVVWCGTWSSPGLGAGRGALVQIQLRILFLVWFASSPIPDPSLLLISVSWNERAVERRGWDMDMSSVLGSRSLARVEHTHHGLLQKPKAQGSYEEVLFSAAPFWSVGAFAQKNPFKANQGLPCRF
jgi:hypothetical protein